MKNLLLLAAATLAVAPTLARAQSLGSVNLGTTAGANTPSNVSTAVNSALQSKVDVNLGVLNGPVVSNPTVTGGNFSNITISSGNVTGLLTVPTAAPNTNNGEAASTQFVNAAVAAGGGNGGAGAGVTSFNTRIGNVTLSLGDVTGVLGFTPASTVSPSFSGVPTAPTPAAGSNNNDIATAAFVNTAIAAIPTSGGSGSGSSGTSRTVSPTPFATTGTGTIATALPLNYNDNILTSCPTGTAAALPVTVSPGQLIYVRNRSGAACSILPSATTSQIESAGLGASVSIPNGSDFIFMEQSTTQWRD